MTLLRPSSGAPDSLPLPVAPAAPAKRRRLKPWHWAPYVFISPFFILFAVFGLFPLLFSLVTAFTSFDPYAGVESMKFLGIENFEFALGDEWFWKSLWNTFWLGFVSGAPQHLVAIPLAYFIHTSFKRWRNAVLGAYFLPYITSTVAIALIFTTLLSTDFGVLNVALAELHRIPLVGALFPAENINWLGKAEHVKPAVAIVVFWRYVGFNTVLYLAALQTIPKDLYEAATMDGATRWQQFRYITLPLLKPMMFFGVTLSVIGGLQLFEEPFVLAGSRGGTDQAAMTTAMYMFRTAFEFNEWGTASAISWLLFICIAVLTWLTNRAFARGGMDS
jgi:multiple sugar transport system permease protein